MNIKEIFDNMNSIEKAEMLELFEKEKEAIQAKRDLREIVNKIFALDSDNPETIRTLAIKFKIANSKRILTRFPIIPLCNFS